MKLTFWGAAQTVTGSMHELDVEGRTYLLDCGQYQGKRKDAERVNRNFAFPPQQVAAVMLSHAHIDHSGNLPLLVKNGFSGAIYASSATADLCRLMLADSASLQEKDAEFLNKRSLRRRALGVSAATDNPVEPLYTVEDAEATYPLFHSMPLHTLTEIGPGLKYRSFEAGHMLGSTSMLLDLESGGRQVRLGFTGDLGRPGLPIIRDPEPLPPVDYLIMESTYGNRVHEPIQSVAAQLAEIVNRTFRRGGKIIVPAFAVGRTQQLVLILHQLIDSGAIPEFPIFVDSPLAVNVTEVFRRHTELYDEEARALLNSAAGDAFGFKRLTYVRDVNQSKALNDLPGPFMVISASGMCEGGRVLHHLKNNIGDFRNTIVLAGYQAENTLGRKIQEHWKEVPIFGELMPLRAEVEELPALSGHADRNEMLAWLKPIAKGLKKVFLVHGEAEQESAFAEAVRSTYGLEVVVPARGSSFDLE